jgi:hypothetical protein
VVLVDTAGRLPTQLHLMEELKKIKRVVQKADATAPHEVLLVIDGNTGQNALTQVKAFDDALALTGLIITKLDGTAKGGVLARSRGKSRFRCISSASAKSSKTWKPSTRASSRRPCCPECGAMPFGSRSGECPRGSAFVARVVRVLAPLLHRVAHGQHLALETRAGLAHRQVQAQRHALLQRQLAVLACDEQRGDLLAGAFEGVGRHHVARGWANQFSSRHSRKRRRARCSCT